jgi:leucyl aminopeptidase (aminopeptidase T)
MKVRLRSPTADGLATAAQVVLDRLGLDSDDAFLVVSNPELDAIAVELERAGRARTSDVRRCDFEASNRDGEEPPLAVAAAMHRASAIVLVTSASLSHTRARTAATRAGARIASMPGISVEIFTRAIPVDYRELEQTGRALAQRLTEASVCRVTAPGGTKIELSIDGRHAICDDGDLRAPGAFGNLPAGEAYIAPIEQNANGAIVFDASLAGWGILAEPLTIEIERGMAVSARGGPASKWLLATLDAGGDSGRTLAELGIGTNRRATISGQILEDEKVDGTVHFAFGTNASFGGVIQADVHIDGLVREASVELDGHVTLQDGGRPAESTWGLHARLHAHRTKLDPYVPGDDPVPK